jgi:ankyrin repeat protein
VLLAAFLSVLQCTAQNYDCLTLTWDSNHILSLCYRCRPHQCDYSGRNAVMIAAEHGHAAIVAVLITAGAAGQSRPLGQTFISNVSFCFSFLVFPFLSLFYNLRSTFVTFLQFTLSLFFYTHTHTHLYIYTHTLTGLSHLSLNNDGESCLHLAARKGHYGVCELLLSIEKR